jgi:glycogen operon protein
VPARPSKHEPIDPTSVGPRFRARTAPSLKLSELTQGIPERKEPPLK